MTHRNVCMGCTRILDLVKLDSGHSGLQQTTRETTVFCKEINRRDIIISVETNLAIGEYLEPEGNPYAGVESLGSRCVPENGSVRMDFTIWHLHCAIDWLDMLVELPGPDKDYYARIGQKVLALKNELRAIRIADIEAGGSPPDELFHKEIFAKFMAKKS